MHSVLVLMSTYNGERFLREQIDSILNQKGVNVHLLVRDDGSSDKTREILKEYEKEGRIRWYYGKNLGAAYSFLDLIKKSGKEDYYAFSDQDDIWDSNKLISAVKVLEQYKTNEIILYSCSSRLIYQDEKVLKENNNIKPVTTFIDSLIHNNNQGCTMVFGQKLKDILIQYNGKNLLMHDDLTLKVCLALGGEVYKDVNAYMGYRQHGNNAIGVKEGLIKSLKRRVYSIVTQSCERSKQLKDIYEIYYDQMPEEKKNILEKIALYKEKKWGKLRLIFDKRIKASDKKTTRHFYVGVILGFF